MGSIAEFFSPRRLLGRMRAASPISTTGAQFEAQETLELPSGERIRVYVREFVPSRDAENKIEIVGRNLEEFLHDCRRKFKLKPVPHLDSEAPATRAAGAWDRTAEDAGKQWSGFANADGSAALNRASPSAPPCLDDEDCMNKRRAEECTLEMLRRGQPFGSHRVGKGLGRTSGNGDTESGGEARSEVEGCGWLLRPRILAELLRRFSA